jgi:hypothetical protein
MELNTNENIEKAFDELSVDNDSNVGDNISNADTIETLNDTKKRKLTRDAFKRNDNGYHVYYIVKRKTKIKIETFSTSCNPGSYIRCPYTGYRTNDKVGTSGENNYFKVNMSSIGNGNNPVILYYPDCESFERHHFINVPQNFKNEWSQKNKYMETPKHFEKTVVN